LSHPLPYSLAHENDLTTKNNTIETVTKPFAKVEKMKTALNAGPDFFAPKQQSAWPTRFKSSVQASQTQSNQIQPNPTTPPPPMRLHPTKSDHIRLTFMGPAAFNPTCNLQLATFNTSSNGLLFTHRLSFSAKTASPEPRKISGSPYE